MSTTENNQRTYLDFLEDVAKDDVAQLRKAEESYGNSWMKRGGVGAFMMLARKWDRIENQVKRRLVPAPAGAPDSGVDAYDIFVHILNDPRPEGVLDDIRDLRCYLMLVEAEMRARTADEVLGPAFYMREDDDVFEIAREGDDRVCKLGDALVEEWKLLKASEDDELMDFFLRRQWERSYPR